MMCCFIFAGLKRGTSCLCNGCWSTSGMREIPSSTRGPLSFNRPGTRARTEGWWFIARNVRLGRDRARPRFTAAKATAVFSEREGSARVELLASERTRETARVTLRTGTEDGWWHGLGSGGVMTTAETGRAIAAKRSAMREKTWDTNYREHGILSKVSLLTSVCCGASAQRLREIVKPAPGDRGN